MGSINTPTRSELVVPIVTPAGKLLGVLDVDSDALAARIRTALDEPGLLDLAERMIRGGFGIHDIYEGVPSIYASRLAAAEAAARGALRGLWSPTTCAGNDHTPAP